MTPTATTQTATCFCGHRNWQHAREGDPRLEVEDFEIGQCYVKDCGCDEFRIDAREDALRRLIAVAEKLPQPATHDGLELADALANARRALATNDD